MAVPTDCPDPIENLKEAVAEVDKTFLGLQKDALKSIANGLDDSVKRLPPDAPAAEQLQILCVSINASADKFNSLRASCNFDPSGCLREIINSGILDSGNPALAGAALAGAIFVDAITGNYESPITGAETGIEVGVTPPTPPAEISLPRYPEPSIPDECPDPVKDMNTALKAAEDTYLDLHKKATQKLSDDVNNVLNDMGGLPTSLQVSALCVTANAGFEIAGGLIASCNIDVGQCIKQVLQSGILGADPALGAAALATATFVDATAGSLPVIR